MTTTDYVRLVRDAEGIIIDSFDANHEFEALQQQVNDLRELLDSTRRIALEAGAQALHQDSAEFVCSTGLCQYKREPVACVIEGKLMAYKNGPLPDDCLLYAPTKGAA